MFISDNHTWASIEQNGIINVGIDDLAVKIIGGIDDVNLPNIGMNVKSGNPLFNVKIGNRTISFLSPVSGRILETNNELSENLELLKINAYDKNWLCKIDAENLDEELKNLKIGKAAVVLYQDDIDKCKKIVAESVTDSKKGDLEDLYIGVLEKSEDKYFNMIVADLFNKQ